MKTNVDVATGRHGGSEGDQAAQDHGFLQTAQVIHPAADCRLGEYSRRSVDSRRPQRSEIQSIFDFSISKRATIVRAVFLIDHENIPYDRVTVREIITCWLDATSDIRNAVRYVDVRAYGGWFQESSASRARFLAADFYQRCPTVLLHNGLLCHLTFSFADKLFKPSELFARDSEPFISHTVAVRSTPLHVQRNSGAICAEEDCELPSVKKWIKKRRACLKPACPHAFDAFFIRYEQKQVDVHLATDLLRACQSDIDDLIVVSEDWDLLPAFLACVEDRRPHQRLTILRFRQTGTYLDAMLLARGARIVTCVPSPLEAAL